jgi:DNA invertase Pin-like site-specific DNA recombinase
MEWLTQLSAAAQLALAGKRERARHREKERVAAGGPCGRAPLGYRYAGPHGKRRLVADPDEQALLKRMRCGTTTRG